MPGRKRSLRPAPIRRLEWIRGEAAVNPSDELAIRVYGSAAEPTLIYLPGIHGDWCLGGSLRRALQGQVRWVEFCYPRSTELTLTDYAQAVRTALQREGIEHGWLLGESFGSQVAWELLARPDAEPRLEVQGLILAGGFVQYPWMTGVRMVGWLVRNLPHAAVKGLLWGYSRYAGFRHRHAPEVRESLEEFVRRRLEPGDREAVGHRLELIRGADPRPVARATPVPVWALAGFWDPVVPWWPVSRWLSRECPRCQGREMLWGADHNVLATQPDQAAGVIRRWMGLAGG